MQLTREYFEKWLEGLKQTWLNKDLDGLEKYFGKIKKYYENPFKIGISFEEVLGFWQEIKNQKDIKLEMDCVTVDGNVGVAHWFFSDDSGEYDGIYQVTFDEGLNCIEFKQWCAVK